MNDKEIREWVAAKLDEAPGSFLKNFLHAVQSADGNNLKILQPAIEALAEKYPARKQPKPVLNEREE